jgi:hypothetical protein
LTRGLTRLDDGFGVRGSSSSEISPFQVWRLWIPPYLTGAGDRYTEIMADTKIVARSKGVLMEVPIIALYNNSWRLSEAIEYMDDIGFVPTQIDPVNYHPMDRQALVEIDCLFRPRDQRLD